MSLTDSDCGRQNSSDWDIDSEQLAHEATYSIIVTHSKESTPSPINTDLHRALKVSDVVLKGSYCHCSTESSTPNPGLTIESLGLIRLPLSEQDAQGIISRAAQAPSGKGLDTAMGTIATDTWEIQSSSVSFANPHWESFIDKIALEKVYRGLNLGRPINTRCELHKLFLYQTGSHLLPHTDASKADGMFATVTIVLPSAFQGGEVHVSHEGHTTVLDVSQESLFTTSVLSWYTGVILEVKPLRSGYQLALSYNLIHTSLNSPAPSLPDAPDVVFKDLRKTLERWKENKYSDIPKLPLFAYILSQQYREKDLTRGVGSLKGKDAQLVTYILPIMEKLGIVLCLANLEKRATGRIPNIRGHRYSYGEHIWDGLSEAEFDEENLSLYNLVCINGGETVDMDLDGFHITVQSLVPQNAFYYLDPDKKNFEGYDCDDAEIELIYRRSAIVFFREEDKLSIMLDIMGSCGVLGRLPLTATPTADAQRVVKAVLAAGLDSWPASLLAKHATSWHDHDLWNSVIPFIRPLECIHEAITDAFEVFELDLIKPGILNLLKRRPGSLDTTNTVANTLSKDVKCSWIEGFIKGQLMSYSKAFHEDVPTLVGLSEKIEGGIEILASTIIPRTRQKSDAYDFHVHLTKSLNEQRAQPNTTVQRDEATNGLARQCLLIAAKQLATSPPPPPPPPKKRLYYTYNIPKSYQPDETPSLACIQQRIDVLIELCFCMPGDPEELCLEVFNIVDVKHQLDVLVAIQTHAGSDAKLGWVKALMKTAMTTYTITDPSHARNLLRIAEETGPRYILKLLQRVSKTGTYEFFLALGQCLHLELERSQSPPNDAYDEAVGYCILMAIGKWEDGVQVDHTKWGPNPKVKRVIELVEFCFTIGDLSPCYQLFNHLLEIPPDVAVQDRFNEVLSPLIPHLRVVLEGKSLTLEPFKSFFKGMICLYLGRILGATPPAQPLQQPTPTVGCGKCSYCRHLNEWLSNSDPRVQFKKAKKTCSHLEKHISEARIGHLITCETHKIGSLYSMGITKRRKLLGPIEWKEAKIAAQRFLQTVGNSDTLKVLMGDRFADVFKALEGTKAFAVGVVNISDNTSTADRSSSGAHITGAAGVKRKRK